MIYRCQFKEVKDPYLGLLAKKKKKDPYLGIYLTTGLALLKMRTEP